MKNADTYLFGLGQEGWDSSHRRHQVNMEVSTPPPPPPLFSRLCIFYVQTFAYVCQTNMRIITFVIYRRMKSIKRL